MATKTAIDYDAATTALERMHEAVEAVVWQLEREHEQPGESAVTYSDLGELWVFVDRIESKAGELRDFASQLRLELVNLDTRRLGD